MLPFLKGIVDTRDAFTGKTGIRLQPWPLFGVGIALLVLAFVFMPSIVSYALSIALFLSPLWMSSLLVGGALIVWLILKRSEFIAKQKYVLLEIKPPRNLVKTPIAMETFLSSIHLSPGEGTWHAKWIKGAVRPYWSLEIASLEGQVHFYIWSRANFRRIIESQLYAQYPGVQVVEAPDYTREISAVSPEWSVWGCDFKQAQPDPLPIKTYVEYGLDKVQKEPEQVDPLANLVEFMGSVGKGEYMWLQLVIRVHKGEKYDKLNSKGKPYTWIDQSKEMIDEIRKATREPYKDPATGKEMPGFPNATKGQMEKIAAIERNVSKFGFDVGARCIYIAKPEKFNPIMITHLTGVFKPFSTEGWNAIRPAAWLTKFDDYPWEYFVEPEKEKTRQALIEAYRRRQFFHPPHTYGLSPKDIMVMSTEELATIFHIPSSSVETPGLGRIPSATSEAPPNLPV